MVALLKSLHFTGRGTPFPGRVIGRNEMKISVELAKASFFNKTAVLSALDKAERQFMSKMGAYVRSDANQSMKRKGKRGRPSPPGTPPRSDVGYLKKFNFFYYDPRLHEVVIGPIRLPRTKYAVPGLHEYGGSVLPRRSSKNKQGKMANYPPRPYMRPALLKNLKRVDELRGSIHR